MSTITSLRAQVTDANHRPRGMMNIEFDGDTHGPYRVIHDGRTYWYTGKSGTNCATGLPVREMATEDDCRLWITLGGTAVWED